jgi:hypothetical protein
MLWEINKNLKICTGMEKINSFFNILSQSHDNINQGNNYVSVYGEGDGCGYGDG